MLEWNVFYHNFNKREITKFNIFKHSRFAKAVEELLNTQTNRVDFADELKRELMYYFWCKSEYEIIISPWGFSNHSCDEELKVDIYNQVMMNWDQFVDYVWNSKSEVFG